MQHGMKVLLLYLGTVYTQGTCKEKVPDQKIEG